MQEQRKVDPSEDPREPSRRALTLVATGTVAAVGAIAAGTSLERDWLGTCVTLLSLAVAVALGCEGLTRLAKAGRLAKVAVVLTLWCALAWGAVILLPSGKARSWVLLPGLVVGTLCALATYAVWKGYRRRD